MSGVISRWEKERAAWLMGRSRPGTSARRRAELLSRQARRLSRGGTGVAQMSLREDITPPLFHRMLATNEGAGERLARMFFVPMLFGLFWLTTWLAVAVGAGIYYLLWKLAPKTGRLVSWHWAAAGAALATIGGVVWQLSGVGTGIWFVAWPPAIHIYPPVFVPFYVWSQATAGLFITAWLIHANGWAAVPKNAAPKPEKDAKGNFIKTPDADKVQLSKLAGDAPTEPSSSQSGEPAKPLPMTALAQLAPPPTDDKSAEIKQDDSIIEFDEDPVFDEDPAEDDVKQN